MRLLVTGGAGFIGSNFIRHMIQQHPGYSIINLDKLTYAGNPDNLRDIANGPNYRFVQGDICDPAAVEPLAREVEVIRAQLKRNRVELVPGTARFLDPHTLEIQGVAGTTRFPRRRDWAGPRTK